MRTLKQTRGFTLIELVVVIVILGILAATAAPKFIDLTGDAKKSIVQGVQGALNSAADLAHAKALVESKTASSGQSIIVDGETINLINGWPTNGKIDDLVNLEDITIGTSGSFATFQYTGSDPGMCLVYYNNDTQSTEERPTIKIIDDGC